METKTEYRIAGSDAAEPELARCEHKFVYGGVKYEVMPWIRLEANTQPVYYYDWFYCERCLEKRYEKLPIEGNTHEEIQFDASPRAE